MCLNFFDEALVHCSPGFVAGGFPCFSFQTCEWVKPAVLDGGNIVAQPSYAIFSLLHSIFPKRNRPVVSQRESHVAQFDRVDQKLDLATEFRRTR